MGSLSDSQDSNSTSGSGNLSSQPSGNSSAGSGSSNSGSTGGTSGSGSGGNGGSSSGSGTTGVGTSGSGSGSGSTGELLADNLGPGLYVDSVSGSDGNSGNSPTQARKTLPSTLGLGAGKGLYLKCGSHFATSLKATGIQGSSGQPIPITGYGDCKADGSNFPVFQLGRRASNFSLYQGSIYVAQLASGLDVRSATYKGQRLRFAQFPERKNGELYLKLRNQVRANSTSFNTEGKLSGLTSSQVIGAYLNIKPAPYRLDDCDQHYSQDSCMIITSFNTSSGMASIARATHYDSTSGASVTAGFYLYNKLWMLNGPGEFVYEPSTGKFYVWLPSGRKPEDESISVALSQERLIDAGNSTYLEFSRIRLRDGAVGVYIANSSYLSFDRVFIEHMASGFILGAHEADPAHHIQISNSHFHISRHKGVVVYKNVTVKSSSFSDIGGDIDQPSSATHAVYALGGSAEVLDSQFENLASGAVFASYRSSIKGNQVDNTCWGINDCGALYLNMLRSGISPATTPSESTISDNTVTRSILASDPVHYGGYSSAIYLDDYTSGTLVANNKVDGTQIGVLIHLGKDNTVSGNTFSNYSEWGVFAQGENDTGYITGHKLINNNFQVNISTSSSLAIYSEVDVLNFPYREIYSLSGNTYPNQNIFGVIKGYGGVGVNGVNLTKSNIAEYDKTYKFNP